MPAGLGGRFGGGGVGMSGGGGNAHHAGYTFAPRLAEFAGRQQLTVAANVDLAGEDIVRDLAGPASRPGLRVRSSPLVVATTFGPSAPDEPSLNT